MQIVRSSEELAIARDSLGGSVALVPTMGALHAGHLSLIEEGRRRADKVIATIFVNPKQFGAHEDLGRYPRTENADAEKLDQAGCDLLWMPGVDDIYPRGFATTIHVAGVSDRWEGEARAGHFDGVATVVAKLLLSVRPDVALFGEKDFQQLAVIRRMVADLSIGAEIVSVPTVRESDGLALSSRNAYLNADQRMQATALHRALSDAREAILRGESVGTALHEAQSSVRAAGFANIDYVALVDGTTLQPLQEATIGARLIVAATIGGTRLIDNLPL